MNDRYLFKAKRKDWKNFPKEEQWVYGYYVRGFNVFEDPIHVILDPTTVFDKDKTDGWDEIDQSTLCQCTGLKDKNGTLIWENDIIHIGDKNILYIVEWHDTGLVGKSIRGTDRIGLKYWINRIVNICNIFDNPELLEVE